jgi:hypothetical protein
MLVERERQPHAVQRRSDRHVHVADDQRAITATASELRAFLDSQRHTGGAHEDVDAAELREIAERVGSAVGFEISRRTNDRRSLIARHPDRDRVAIDELTETKYRRRTAPRPYRAALSSMVMSLAGENLTHEAENRTV